MQHKTGLSFCSECLAGQLLAPIFFWRAHKYSTKILCSSPLVLELKAVGGSRTDFCLELEQLYSPGAAQVWSECSVWPQGWQESCVEMALCLDQHFWPPVQSQGSQCSHVSAVFRTWSCWCFPGEYVPTLISLWLLEKPTKTTIFLSQNILQQLLNPVDLLLYPMWGFQHREA